MTLKIGPHQRPELKQKGTCVSWLLAVNDAPSQTGAQVAFEDNWPHDFPLVILSHLFSSQRKDCVNDRIIIDSIIILSNTVWKTKLKSSQGKENRGVDRNLKGGG